MFYIQHKNGIVLSVAPVRQSDQDVEITTTLADEFYSGQQMMSDWCVQDGKMVSTREPISPRASHFLKLDLPLEDGRVTLPPHLRHRMAYYINPNNPNHVIASTIALNDVQVYPDTLLVIGGVLINAN